MDKELEQIVQRMIDAGESEENIALVIRKFDSVMGKPEGVQTAAVAAAPVTPEEPQQPTTFQRPSPLLEQESPIGVAAPKTEKDILFERDKGKMLSAADPKAFTPEDYATKKTNEDIARKYIKDNESNALWAFNDEEGLLENLQNAFGVLAPGESGKLLDELKDVDFKYTDSILGRIQKYYPEELGTLSQSASRQLQAGYEKPMNSYQEDVILNTVVGGDFDEDVLRWTRTRQAVDGEPGAFISAIGGAKSSEEIVSQAIKNLHDNKDISSYTKLRSIYNQLDESSESSLRKNTELFLDQYEKDLTINPIKKYVGSADLDSYTKKSTTSDELIIDQSKINPEDFIPGYENLSSSEKENVKNLLSSELINKLEGKTINDVVSKQEGYEELFGKIGDKMQAQLENSSDLYASSQEELNAAANSINDKYEVQLFNKRNKLDKAFENRNNELVELYQSGGLSDKEYDDQFNKLNSEYKTSFDSLVDNLNKEYKNEINSSVLPIEQKYKDGLNKEIQSLYKDYKLTPEEQKEYSEIYEKAREKLNEDRVRYLIPEGSSPDASISALSGFYQPLKTGIGTMIADMASEVGNEGLGEYGRGLENRYQLPEYAAGEAPFSMRLGKGIASSLPSFVATAAGTGALQKVTRPLMKMGTLGKAAGLGINLLGGGLVGGATETAQMMAATRREAINRGRTTEEANKLADEIFDAQVANFYIYGLDALPFMKGAFKGINKIIPNRYIAGATKIGVGAGFESVTETGQETVQTAFETQIEESFKTTGVASYKDFEDNVNLNLIKETFLEVYPSTMLMGGGSQALTISKDEVDIWKEAAKNPKNIQRAIDVASITQSVDSKKALNQKVMWSMLTKGKDFTKAWINAASNLHLVSNTFNGSRGITAQEKSELLNLVDSQEQTINDLNSQTPNMSLINKLVHNYIQVDINELNAELESLKGKSVSKSKRNKIQKLLDKRGLELEQIENNPEQNSNALNLISIDNQAPFVLNDKELSNVLETSNDLFSRLIDDKININLSKTGKKIVSNALVKNNVYITNEIIDKLQNTPNVVLLKTEKEWENNLGQKREEGETAVNRNGKKYVYLPAASSLEDISAGSHELVHDVISPILFEVGEDKKVVFDENNRPVISEEGHNLIDGFLNRLPLAERNALEVEFKANYQTRNDRDEYFTLYHRMLVQGNYKRSGLDKVKNLINSIIKTNGYTSGELTAKGIQNFLKDYSNDIAVGRLSDNVKTFAAKQIGKGVEIQTIKFSRKELGDSIKVLVPEGTTKTEYSTDVLGKVYLDIIASSKLHPLINNNLARFGVPREQVTDEFYEDVKNQLFERSLQRFDPEKNDDLGGFVINELQRFAIPDIVNQYKDQGRFQATEQIEAAPAEGRVRPMQVAEETTTEEVIERAEEQEAKEQEQTFREKLGIEKEGFIYNRVVNSVRRTFGTKLPPVTDSKFRIALIKSFKTDLMKPMKDFIGKKEKYKDFVFNNFDSIMGKIPTREWVRLEQQEENKIFAELVTARASTEEVDNAVSKGLYLLPGASRVSGTSIYRKLDTTPEQLWKFLAGNNAQINGARKTALTERLVQELAFDATMMVLKDPKYNALARVQEIAELTGGALEDNFDAQLGAVIERDPSITRFSSKKQNEALQNIVAIKLFETTPKLINQDIVKFISQLANTFGYLSQPKEDIEALSPGKKGARTKAINGLKNTFEKFETGQSYEDFIGEINSNSTLQNIIPNLLNSYNKLDNGKKYEVVFVIKGNKILKNINPNLEFRLSPGQGFDVELYDKKNKTVLDKIELKYGSPENGPWLTSVVYNSIFNEGGELNNGGKTARDIGSTLNFLIETINEERNKELIQEFVGKAMGAGAKINNSGNGFNFETTEQRQEFEKGLNKNKPLIIAKKDGITNEKQLSEFGKGGTTLHYSEGNTYQVGSMNEENNLQYNNSTIPEFEADLYNKIMFSRSENNYSLRVYLQVKELKTKNNKNIEDSNVFKSYTESVARQSRKPQDDLKKFSNVRSSKKHRSQYETSLAKRRSDLNKEQITEQVDSIFNWLDTTDVPNQKKKKFEELALFYMYQPGFILPEDGFKIIEAERITSIKGIDPRSYSNPTELINEFGDTVKKAYINPSKVSTLTRIEEGAGADIDLYEVDNSKKGQDDLADIVESHLGRKTSPWCITAKKGGKVKREIWNEYGNYKVAAFKDGKIHAIGVGSKPVISSDNKSMAFLQKITLLSTGETFDIYYNNKKNNLEIKSAYGTDYKVDEFSKYFAEDGAFFDQEYFKAIGKSVFKDGKVKGVIDNWWDRRDVPHKQIPTNTIRFSKKAKDTKGVDKDAKAKETLSQNFNTILKQKTGIETTKEYSKAQARAAAQRKKYRSFYIPPSAEDFLGLMYAFLSPGKQGEKQLKFIEDNLITPMNEAFNNWAQAKYVVARDFKVLLKKHKGVREKLNKFVPNTDFTIDQAIRVYLYDKAGYSIPGISEAELKAANSFVTENQDIYNFANELRAITRIPEGFKKPDENWIVSTLTSEMYEISQEVIRAQFFEKVNENFDTVFSEGNLNKIEAHYGSKFREALEDSIYSIKTGSKRNFGGNRHLNEFNDWLNGSVGVIMFLNSRSAVLQLISATNYINWSDNNIAKASMAFANQPQFWSDFVYLFNSPYLKERRSGLQTDINLAELQASIARSENKAKAAVKYLLEKGFILTKAADSFAIASGGATFYRNRVKTYTKQGFSQKEAEAQAFTDFQNLTETNQQSARPDKISQQQRGPLGRVILAFANTSQQYGREIKKASLDLINGRGDWKTNISKIVYYGAVQNLIFNTMQTGLFALLFDDDDELDEQWFDRKGSKVANGMIDTILRGTGITGAIIATVKNVILEWINQHSKGHNSDSGEILVEAFNISPPLGSKARKLKVAHDILKYDSDLVKAYGYDIDNPLVDASANIISATTNVPLDRVLRKIDNVSAALDADNEIWQRIATMGGWNTWDVGVEDVEKEEKEKEAKEDKKKAKKKAKKEAKKEPKKPKGNDPVPTYNRKTYKRETYKRR